MGARSRRKGAVYERAVAARFRDIFPDAKRGYAQSRGGEEQADVEIPYFWVQTKHGKFISIRDAYHQSVAEVMDSNEVSKMPIAVTKFDNDIDLVTISFDDFLTLIRELKSRGYF